MHIKKKDPYQFWLFRDTRREKFKSPKPLELPQISTDTPKIVQGLVSHHILLPIKELPVALLNRLRADLTLRNPVFDKARKYGKGFVSYAIPEFFRFYSMDSEYLGLPRSVKMSYLHKKLETCGLKLVLKDIRPPFEEITWPDKGVIKPRFYQKEAIEQILKGNCIIKLRCGLGKTMLCLLAISQLRLRTLILVRTNILLRQWVDSIREVFKVPEKDIGIINGKNKREGLITVATEQSLANMSRSEKRHIGSIYGHVVVDECLTYNTQVLTDQGFRSIGDIINNLHEDIKVLSYNENTRKNEFKSVISGTSKGFREVMEIEIEKGKSIRGTPDHLFYVKEKGWVKACNLQIGDDLLDFL